MRGYRPSLAAGPQFLLFFPPEVDREHFLLFLYVVCSCFRFKDGWTDARLYKPRFRRTRPGGFVRQNSIYFRKILMDF